MTPDKQMEVIQEAAGECRHHTGGYVDPQIGIWTCSKCGEKGFGFDESPFPDDLNALSRLAKKLGLRVKIVEYSDGFYASTAEPYASIEANAFTASQYKTEAEARRVSLVKAIEGRK
jgi:ABC-type metal ion transport system substrate-binding protein